MMTSRVVFPLIALLIICLCICEEVSALSSPARVNNGYHFGISSSTIAAVPKNNKKKLKASDIVPKRQTSYIPDGLTEEQYNKIKSVELAKTQSMNFGAWGPRFKQVGGDPEFWNWFSSPTLWTGGFNSNSGNNNNMANGRKKNRIANFIMIYMRRYALVYMMMLLSTQALAKSVLPATKVWSTKYVVGRILWPIVTLKPINMLASLFAERRSIPWLKTNGTNKLAAVVAMLITAVSFALS